MSSQRALRISTAVAIACALTVSVRAQRATTAADLLRLAEAYVAAYEQQFSAIVSEERYTQTLRAMGMPIEVRQLRSDVLVVSAGEGDWIGFRDVFEVDGGRIRDRDERLSKLFLSPTADALAQGKRIAVESARFNIGPGNRTVNIPTMALMFLRAGNQARSTFAARGQETIEGLRAAVLTFQERARPRMIYTPEGVAARGRFFIDPATGRVLGSELFVDTKGVNATVKVRYAKAATTDLWVPIRMDEEYKYPRNQTVFGRATYENFRSFKVDTSTIIKKF